MICTTYFLTFFSELIPPTGILILNIKRMLWNFRGLPYSFFFKVKKKVTPFPGLLFADICPL